MAAGPNVRFWLKADYPTTSALRLVYPQKRKFVPLCAMRKMPDYRSFRIGGGGLAEPFVRFAQYLFSDVQNATHRSNRNGEGATGSAELCCGNGCRTFHRIATG